MENSLFGKNHLLTVRRKNKNKYHIDDMVEKLKKYGKQKEIQSEETALEADSWQWNE